MTQPVQEPSQGRTDQGQEFRTRQLFRRPAPAPSGVTEEIAYATPVYLPVMEVWSASNQIDCSGGANSYAANDWIIDATYPGGGYCQDTVNNHYIQFLCRMGPRNSVWGFLPLLGTGPDYGIVEIQIQTFPPITPNPVNNSVDPEGDPESGNTTWTVWDTIDCYEAVETVRYFESGFTRLRINGDLNVVGTTAPVSGIDNARQWDGGPGYNKIRVYTNGQNASSTGYKVRLGGLVLVRLDDSYLP